MKKQLLLCPSIMCCDFDRLSVSVTDLETAGCDIMHCDVMDGSYVANIALGLEDVKTVCRNTSLLVDVHLMVSKPETVCSLFLQTDVDIIYIHPATSAFPSKLLLSIKEAGKKAGIVYNPHEPAEQWTELLPLCDYVLIMTVHPGFAGQTYLDWVDPKITKLIQWKSAYHYQLIIDGACSPDVIARLSKVGADGFVLGTAALFNKGQSYGTIIKELRKISQ
ncbi:MAG: ribulose-phosphate 3-epimerase [Erysipelotrichaceae bacterium]|nr:ribulose-phosphate 3-epimerase [Erysipelotrichaceae bacterium]